MEIEKYLDKKMKTLVEFILEAKSSLPEWSKDILEDKQDCTDEKFEQAYKYFMELESPKGWLKCKQFLQLLHDGELDVLCRLGKTKDHEGKALDKAIDKMPAKLRGTSEIATVLDQLTIYLFNKLNPKKEMSEYNGTFQEAWTNMIYFRNYFTDKEYEEAQRKRKAEYPKKIAKWLDKCDNIVYAGSFGYTEPKLKLADFTGFWEDVKDLDVSKFKVTKWDTANGEYKESLKDAYNLAIAMYEGKDKQEIIKLLDYYRSHGNGDPWYDSLCHSVDERKTAWGMTIVNVMLMMGTAKYLGINDWSIISDYTFEQIKKAVEKK